MDKNNICLWVVLILFSVDVFGGCFKGLQNKYKRHGLSLSKKRISESEEGAYARGYVLHIKTKSAPCPPVGAESTEIMKLYKVARELAQVHKRSFLKQLKLGRKKSNKRAVANEYEMNHVLMGIANYFKGKGVPADKLPFSVPRNITRNKARTEVCIEQELVVGNLRGFGRERPDAQKAELYENLKQGLAVIHGSGIVHCDIKPENIGLDSLGRGKFFDFGFSSFEPRLSKVKLRGAKRVAHYGGVRGTVNYYNPSMFFENLHESESKGIKPQAPCNRKSDLYSFFLSYLNEFLPEYYRIYIDTLREQTGEKSLSKAWKKDKENFKAASLKAHRALVAKLSRDVSEPVHSPPMRVVLSDMVEDLKRI